MIAVAIDEAADTIRDFIRDHTDGITYPVLMDTDHLLTELYAISNVPTVVLIDENDTIAQPNWNAYATDTFKDFTDIDSGAQLDAIRRWVIDGETLMTDRRRPRRRRRPQRRRRAGAAPLPPRRPPAQRRRHLGAERNFDRACELAPNDWTIRRASIPLRGGDPFGAEFFELLTEFQAAGAPYHGVNHSGIPSAP